MSIKNLHELVKPELSQVSALISHEFNTPTSVINEVSKHISTSGGKKLRPTIVLLGAKCFNADSDIAVRLATVIEFFHISSLLHDDVVDNAKIRRGKTSAHNIWGNKASILVGDYLFSKAFQLLVSVNNQKILTTLANTSNIITQGEVQQLMSSHNPDIETKDYMNIIHHKTAALFEAASQMGALIANKDDIEIQAMAKFGHYLGKAFQIVDDIFDYQPSNNELGKNVGNDLAEGKITLPLIHAIKHSSAPQQAIIKDAIAKGNTENIDQIQEILKETKAIEASEALAEKQINQAVTELFKIEPSIYRDALESLALFTIERKF